VGITLQPEAGNVRVLRFTGLLRKAEVDTVQAAAAKQFEKLDTVKVLVVVENFEGWERGADWGDLSFFLKYGDRMEKIAIVGDPKWEEKLLMFAGAGFRKAPVKFFSSDKLTEARTWLG
jgi:hypothetical protein